jgi:hypothetical protein
MTTKRHSYFDCSFLLTATVPPNPANAGSLLTRLSPHQQQVGNSCFADRHDPVHELEIEVIAQQEVLKESDIRCCLSPPLLVMITSLKITKFPRTSGPSLGQRKQASP